MLTMSNKNITIDGQSFIGDKMIASFNANINGANEMGSGMYINISVSDIDGFVANKSTVIADFNTFCDTVVKMTGIEKATE